MSIPPKTEPHYFLHTSLEKKKRRKEKLPQWLAAPWQNFTEKGFFPTCFSRPSLRQMGEWAHCRPCLPAFAFPSQERGRLHRHLREIMPGDRGRGRLGSQT